MRKFTINFKSYFVYFIAGAIFFIIIVMMFDSGKHERHAVKQKMFSVKSQYSSNILYYEGLVAPLARIAVISDVDGIIDQIFFTYGDMVKKNQLLYAIKLSGQKTDFQDALTNYIKAKRELDDSQTDKQNAEQLFNQGIISRDDYQEAQKQYFLDRLSFIQAQNALSRIFKMHGIDKIPNLSIKNVAIIKKEMDAFKKQATSVKIYAPVSGITLFPEDNNGKRFVMGSQVKSGDILLYLGDIKGISVRVQINEMDINRFRIGQMATITSDAFPNIILYGKIKTIDKQAKTSGNIPVFSAIIEVPILTNKQRLLVRVGMSTKVAVNVRSSVSELLIPIKAVYNKNGKYAVKVFDKKKGTIKEVIVNTGRTTKNLVNITGGLKAGDQIIVPN